MDQPDAINHQPVRLKIMAALKVLPAGEALEFVRLKTIVGATEGNLGAHIATLEQAGYVERIPDPDDRRATRIRLTARGRSYGHDVRRFGRALEDRLAGRVGERRLMELRATLDLLLESLRSDAKG